MANLEITKCKMRLARQILMFSGILGCVFIAGSLSVSADTDSPAMMQLSSLNPEPSDPLVNDARRAYRNASYLQAMRLSRKVLARHPEHHSALLIFLQSMAQLGILGQTAEAAIHYAERYHPNSADINKVISQLYLAQGNQRKAGYYHKLSKRQFCPFNCQ